MAITLVPGQIVASGEWDELFKQHGGMPTTTQAVRRSRTEAEIKAAATAGDDDPAAQQRPIYRYVLADGSYVDARTAPDGSGWEVVDYKPSAKFTQDPANKPPATAASTRPPIPPGGSSVTEGTPLPDGTWDNNRPRQVIKDKNGTVVWTEELTGADLSAWRAQQQANQPQSGEVRKPVDGRPGWTSITRTAKQGGNETTTTVYVGPDGKEVPTLPEQPKDPTVQIVPINGQRYQVRTTPGAAGQPPRVEWLDPSGKPIAQPPIEASKPHVETATINGQRYTTVTTVGPDGGVKIEHSGPDGKPVAALPTEGRRQLPAGLPTLDTSNAQRARETYLAQQAWAQQQVAEGNLSSKEAVELLTPSHQAAETVIQAEQRQIENTRATRTQDIQQEGYRLTAATSQFGALRNGVDETIKWAPRGGREAGNVYLANLLTQQLMSQSTRGNVGPASTIPAPVPTPLPNPNALSELGGQPGDPAPSATVTPAMVTGVPAVDNLAAAAASVGPERTAQIRANPVFKPMAPVGSPVLVGAGATPTITPPAVQGTPSPLGDTGAPPISMAPDMDLTGLPPALQRLYGRSIIDGILAGRA